MNGRLAMIGFSGMLHHAILTKQGPIQQIVESNFVSGAASRLPLSGRPLCCRRCLARRSLRVLPVPADLTPVPGDAFQYPK